jgi:hypothetical protein
VKRGSQGESGQGFGLSDGKQSDGVFEPQFGWLELPGTPSAIDATASSLVFAILPLRRTPSGRSLHHKVSSASKF